MISGTDYKTTDWTDEEIVEHAIHRFKGTDDTIGFKTFNENQKRLIALHIVRTELSTFRIRDLLNYYLSESKYGENNEYLNAQTLSPEYLELVETVKTQLKLEIENEFGSL